MGSGDKGLNLCLSLEQQLDPLNEKTVSLSSCSNQETDSVQ